ncbi:MAG: CHAD domain-containing protein [Oscillochloris sp.]|nr:CHAD domain-containing protein [Oscillochloris sp.]
MLLDDLNKRVEREELTNDAGLEALQGKLQAARTKLHAQLCETLEDDDFQAFAADFAALMNDGAGWKNDLRVRDLAGSTIWKRYEELRFFDRDGLPAVEAELHLMRIAGKRLRYSLELFADTFGERVEHVVNPLIAFQDHVGVLQDVVVATELLARYTDSGESRSAADAYLAVRAEQVAKLRAELPARWDKVGNGTFRRNLMGLIVKL